MPLVGIPLFTVILNKTKINYLNLHRIRSNRSKAESSLSGKNRDAIETDSNVSQNDDGKQKESSSKIKDALSRYGIEFKYKIKVKSLYCTIKDSK